MKKIMAIGNLVCVICAAIGGVTRLINELLKIHDRGGLL